MGATTIWERWDCMLEDGSINPGEMTSFNHYALGAIADWLHRSSPGSPRPRPATGSGSRRSRCPGSTGRRPSHETPYGRRRWVGTRGDRITVRATVPPNTAACVQLPDGRAFEVGSGDHEWLSHQPPADPPAQLTMSTSLAAIMDDPQAYQTVLDAFNRIDPAIACDFNRRMAWVPNQPLSAPSA